MVVGFSTTCAINAYHHECYEFESRWHFSSGQSRFKLGFIKFHMFTNEIVFVNVKFALESVRLRVQVRQQIPLLQGVIILELKQ
jgi:hypothetical protein